MTVKDTKNVLTNFCTAIIIDDVSELTPYKSTINPPNPYLSTDTDVELLDHDAVPM